MIFGMDILRNLAILDSMEQSVDQSSESNFWTNIRDWDWLIRSSYSIGGPVLLEIVKASKKRMGKHERIVKWVPGLPRYADLLSLLLPSYADRLSLLRLFIVLLSASWIASCHYPQTWRSANVIVKWNTMIVLLAINSILEAILANQHSCRISASSFNT